MGSGVKMKEEKEKSIYGLKFPVKIAVKKDEEPMHWHKDLEILCVLKGRIRLQVNNAFYDLKEDDIFLINSEDLHRITLLEEKSIFLTMDIMLEYYEKYFVELEYIVFIDDDSINTGENNALQKDIKRRIAQMLVEIKNKNIDYQNRIIYNTSSLLAALINQFNMVKKNSKSFRNKEQFSRIWKAYEYMYTHYQRRITIGEVADYVHISSSHLSHVIKNTMGLSFEKWINQIRAEHSMKFLLNSDKSIAMISKECGFSDPKYFKQYFELFFQCTPQEYRTRNQHKVAESGFQSRSHFETILFGELLNKKIEQYLDRDEEEDGAVDLMLDFSNTIPKEIYRNVWKEELVIHTKDYPLLLWNPEKIKNIQEELTFQYIYIKDLMYSNLVVCKGGRQVLIDWNELDRLIAQIKERNAYPKLGFSIGNLEEEVFCSVIEKFLFHYKLRYSEKEVVKWIMAFHMGKSSGEAELKSLIKKTVLTIVSGISVEFDVFEEIFPDSDASSTVFIKEVLLNKKKYANHVTYLMDHRGIKSNLYFAYYMLNKLEPNIIEMGNNYIVTKGYNKLSLLIFHSRGDGNKQELAINITNLKRNRYLLKHYSMYSEEKAMNRYIKNATLTDYISEEDVDSINRGRYPDLRIEFFEHFESIHRSITVEPNCAELITLERVL